MKKFSYGSMGTTWEVTIWDEISEDRLKTLESEIKAKSQVFDETYSRFIKDSWVSNLAQKTGLVSVPEDFMNMLKLYFDLYLPSERKLNPLIGFTISDLGYDADYSLVTKETVRKTPDLFETIKIVDESHIEIKEPVLFDLGALGKGYFVDVIEKYLTQQGMKRFLVNGSGDISYKNWRSANTAPSTAAPITVGLEHPSDTSKVIGTIEMTGEPDSSCMCSSGTNRRKWGKYNHVIDPHISSSQEEIVATWVIAPTTALADALASCLFFAAPENFSSKYKFEYCIMNKDNKIKYSPGFKASFY